MRIRTATIAFLISSFVLSTTAMAQQRHILEAVQLTQAVSAQTATDRQNRELLLGALRLPDVQSAAKSLGLNVTRAESAVATLSGAELTRYADQARNAGAPLAGGSSTVIISTTTLLLILIIVILLAD